MSMIRVFPSKTKWTPTDVLAFVGDPPLFRPGDRTTPVHVSVTFTWDKREAERLQKAWSQYYDDVRIGGPAYDDPGGEFVPGRYMKQGVTITSRGCPKKCPWCVVPTREGRIRELEIKPGWIVQDNNLLACSRGHVNAVFGMLRGQNRRCCFNGGLDSSFLQDWHVDLFRSVKLDELWFACDTPQGLPRLERVAKMLEGISIEKRRCYVLMGFDGETIVEANERVTAVYEMGFLPFAQLYRDDTPRQWSRDWKDLQRFWSRPAAYRSVGRAGPADLREVRELPE